MSLMALLNVSLAFQGRVIFNKIGFQIDREDRIGLVGRNGSGKTSLLRLIAGEHVPDSGEIRIAKGAVVGYLPQDIHETLSGPLFESVYNSIPGRRKLDEELNSTEYSLKKSQEKSDQTILGKRLAEIHQEINNLELQFPLHDVEKILLGLGFHIADFEKPISVFSGGWKMRAALASLLYRKPDLLLLDEPTNHLDIPAVRWLEQFLQNYRGAIILVSHDRDFLNRQILRTIGFENEGMRQYSGNYDGYLNAREQEKQIIEAKARNFEQKVKEAQKFIERFHAKASKARQAKSKAKLIKKVELVETHKKDKTIRFSFPDVPRSGKNVLTVQGVGKSFDENVLYEDLNLTVQRGERIAIIGPNGCGKTTMLRMVAGEITPDRGKISLGHGVSIGYFAQHHSEMLNTTKKVIEEVYQIVPDESIGFVRNVCGAFLFSGDEVDKKIEVLSGGERARVALARLLVKPGNFMVMDEPTNHLDLDSSEILIDALSDFSGTLLFVSHNQSFVNRLATKIWDIRDGEFYEYPGNLYEYYDHISREEEEERPNIDRAKGANRGENQKETQKGKRQNRKALKRERAEKRRIIGETIKPISMELESLEEEIGALELREKELEKKLADPELFSDKDRSVPLLKEYHEVRGRLDELLLKWETCQDKLESTKRQLGLDS